MLLCLHLTYESLPIVGQVIEASIGHHQSIRVFVRVSIPPANLFEFVRVSIPPANLCEQTICRETGVCAGFYTSCKFV